MRKGGSSHMIKTPIHENLFRLINKHQASTPIQTLGVSIVQTAKTSYVFFLGSKYNKTKLFY